MNIFLKIAVCLSGYALLVSGASADWSDIPLAPTGITSIESLGSDGNTLYAVGNNKDLWSYNGTAWEKLHTAKYSYGKICVIAGKVYANEGYYDLSGRTWNPLSLPASTWVTGERFRVDSCMGESIGMIYDTVNPKIIVYTPSNRIFLNTGFSATWLDGKPHVDLVSDGQGRLLYLSNYSGVYLYNGSTWQKVRDESGAIGRSADGIWYHSIEIGKTTQLARVHRSHDGLTWESVAEAQGYAYKCYPYSVNSAYCIDGRFGAFILGSDGKRTNLSGYDTNLGDRDLRIPQVQVMGSVIYQVKVRGGSTTLQKYTPDMGAPAPTSVSQAPLVVTPPPQIVAPVVAVVAPTSPVNSTVTSPQPAPPTITPAPVPVAPILPALASSIDLKYATYLTPGLTSQAVGLASSGENIYIAVNAPTGVIKVFDPVKQLVIHEINFPDKILDFKVSADRIYTVTATNTYITDLLGAQITNAGGWKRITLGKNGEFYVLGNNTTITRYNAAGKSLGNRVLVRAYAEDILYHASSDRLLVVGFDNKKLPGGNPVQVAYLLAFNSGFELQYTRFGFNGADLARNIADTRLYHLSLGADDRVYLLGESAGSQTIFRYDGVRYAGAELLSKIDIFTELWNTGSAHIAYFAKLDPSTGNIENSALSMSRLLSTKWKGKSNTYRVRDGAIAADKNGNIVVAGINTSTFGGRDNVRIMGQSLNTYSGSDGTLQALDSRLKSRKFWVTLGKSGGSKSEMRDVLLVGDTLYYLGSVQAGEVFTTDGSTRGGAETVQFGAIGWR